MHSVMTPRQIRIGMAASALLVVTTVSNLLLMQPTDGGSPRVDRHYRGLSHLPGVPSTTIQETTIEETAALPPTPRRAEDPAASRVRDLTRAVQEALAARGYAPGDRTGTLDMVTRAAIMAFEYDRKLPMTAEPSLELLAELQSDVPSVSGRMAPQAPSEAATTVVRAVQQSLARLDYQPGGADGVAGEATAKAIRAFERDHGLPQTGRVSGLLVARLATVGDGGKTAAR